MNTHIDISQVAIQYAYTTEIPLGSFRVRDLGLGYVEVSGARASLPYNYWSVGSIAMQNDTYVDIFKLSELEPAHQQRLRSNEAKSQLVAKPVTSDQQAMMLNQDGCEAASPNPQGDAQTKEIEVSIGSLVKLNSGGPLMTVTDLVDNTCTVCHFAGIELLKFEINVAALTFIG